ncbi:hypothetical protein V6N11_064354 [Hibiscus sabdariffa]|uniref:Pentatricopeptide repeat-containing protein n=1 Tax=Hibiscus sabdariffa TaxID=183260 RepID=A0ABR2PNU7_9ROSI
MVSLITAKRLSAFALLSPVHRLFSSASHSVVPNATSHSGSQSSNPLPNQPNVDHETVRETLSCYSDDWKRRSSSSTGSRPIATSPTPPRPSTRCWTFLRYVTAHLVNEAIATFHRLEEFNLKDEISFCNLVDAPCEYKHVVEAHELCFLGKNKDLGFNVNDTKIHNMILRGWFKMGWWSKCREFWEEMDKKGVKKDLHSYSIYMDIMCKSGKPWKAVKLYKEMKKKGMKLDVVVYNTVIRAIGVSDVRILVLGYLGR